MSINLNEEHDYIYCGACGGAAIANRTPRGGAPEQGFDSQCLECRTEFVFHPVATAQPIA